MNRLAKLAECGYYGMYGYEQSPGNLEHLGCELYCKRPVFRGMICLGETLLQARFVLQKTDFRA